MTFIREDNDKVLLGPEKMVTIPPRHYCVIDNPVLVDDKHNIILDEYGQAKIRHGDSEIRFAQDPFPLYPGEKLASKVTPLQVLPPNKALHLVAIRDFKDGDKTYNAGDEWLFAGPATYTPRVEANVLKTVDAIILKPNEALKLQSRRECTDSDGVIRKTGEVWLVLREGSYMPSVDEEVSYSTRSEILFVSI